MFLYFKHNVPNLEKKFSSMPHHENDSKKKKAASSSCPISKMFYFCVWKRKETVRILTLCPAWHFTDPKAWSPVGEGEKWGEKKNHKKPVHYQKFLTKQFLQKDLGARIVKLKGTVSLKSSCTGPASFCNLGNSFQKELGHSNGRRTWAV